MSDARFLRRIDTLRTMLDQRSARLGLRGESRTLEAACAHVFEGGGKRIRGILLLLACESVGGNVRAALNAGVAVETLHNFTLVHDDIMDNADSRRGRPTVHTKWDANTAILTGDVLMGLAYESLARTPSESLTQLFRLLTRGVIEVCDGQAADMELAKRTDVTLPEYFAMIGKKTGSLIALATEMGGVIGGGTAREIRALRTFGRHLGRAFQLQDDLLDVVADERTLGKPVGGDIVEGKKTFLLICAAERATGEDRALVDLVLRGGARRETVDAVTDLYQRYGILDEAGQRILSETRLAGRALAGLHRSRAAAMLQWLAGALVHRAS
jgi:geranylgeranyl diphosphate synthase type II